MPILNPRKCASKDCGIEFVPRVRNQRYHSNTCANRESSRRRNKKIKQLLKQVAQAQQVSA